MKETKAPTRWSPMRREDTTGCEMGSATASGGRTRRFRVARQTGGDRDNVPVTMLDDSGVGERGVMGAPRSHKRRGPQPVGPHKGPRG